MKRKVHWQYLSILIYIKLPEPQHVIITELNKFLPASRGVSERLTSSATTCCTILAGSPLSCTWLATESVVAEVAHAMASSSVEQLPKICKEHILLRWQYSNMIIDYRNTVSTPEFSEDWPQLQADQTLWRPGWWLPVEEYRHGMSCQKATCLY